MTDPLRQHRSDVLTRAALALAEHDALARDRAWERTAKGRIRHARALLEAGRPSAALRVCDAAAELVGGRETGQLDVAHQLQAVRADALAAIDEVEGACAAHLRACTLALMALRPHAALACLDAAVELAFATEQWGELAEVASRRETLAAMVDPPPAHRLWWQAPTMRPLVRVLFSDDSRVPGVDPDVADAVRAAYERASGPHASLLGAWRIRTALACLIGAGVPVDRWPDLEDPDEASLRRFHESPPPDESEPLPEE